MIEKIKNKISKIKNNEHFFEVLKGSFWSFGAKILAVILGLLFNLLITRVYGVESMGIVALVNSFFVLTLILSLMGTNTAILKLVPEFIGKYSFSCAIRVYWKIVIIVICLSLIVTVFSYVNIGFISEVIFKNNEINYLLSLAVLFIIAQALGILNTSSLRAFKAIKLFSFFQVYDPLSKLLILVALTLYSINKYNPIYAIFFNYVLVMILSFIAVWFIMKNKSMVPSLLEVNPKKNISYISIIKISLPMFLTAAMYLIMSQTDIIMLGIMSSIENVGIYAVAMKLAVLTSFILGTINTLAVPKFSELYHAGKIESLKYVAQKSSKLMFWTAFPLVIVFVISGKGMLSLFGEEYMVAYITLLLLVAGQFVNAMVGSVGFFLSMTGYQKELNLIVILAAILNILLNYLIIPLYGIVGAAFASAVSLILWNVIAAVYIKIKFGFYIGYLPTLYITKKG